MDSAPRHFSTSVLWRSGDDWRPLLEEINTSGQVIAIVTVNFTTRLVDVSGHRQARLPLRDGHRLEGDYFWHHLSHVELATPCGVRTVGRTPDAWHMTTPVLLVAAVDVADRDAFDTVFPTDNAWTAPGHPEDRCGALYCLVDELHQTANPSPTQ